MKIHKRKAIKEKVDPYSIKRTVSGDAHEIVRPGPRADNAWCLYTENNIPKNETDWNEVRYTYACYVGYHSWPKSVQNSELVLILFFPLRFMKAIFLVENSTYIPRPLLNRWIL